MYKASLVDGNILIVASDNVLFLFFYRALYFTSYAYAKQKYNSLLPHESPVVHLCSAVSAGVCCVCTTLIALFFPKALQLLSYACTCSVSHWHDAENALSLLCV